MTITPDDVRRIARLAAIEVPEAEVEPLARQLDQIVSYVGQLPPGGETSADHRLGLPTVLRPDVVAPAPLDRLPAAFAPDFGKGFFLVPKLPSMDL